MDITKFFDLNSIRNIAKNTFPIIAPVIFIYLYLIKKETYLIILGLLSLLFLSFYINLHQGMGLALHKKIKNIKTTNEIELLKKVITFLFKDKLYLSSLILSFALSLMAFIILLFNLVDGITWALLFLWIFAVFHYITGFISDIYVGHKYRKLFKKKS